MRDAEVFRQPECRIAEEAEVLGKPPADLIVAVERREI